MLSVYFTIFIVLAVIAAFFGVCVISFGKNSEEAQKAERAQGERQRGRHFAPNSPLWKRIRELFSDIPDDLRGEAGAFYQRNTGKGAPSDETRVYDFPLEIQSQKPNSADEGMEKTIVFDRNALKQSTAEIKKPETDAAASAGNSAFPKESAPQIVADDITPEELEEYFVRHFLNQYGAVSKTAYEDTRAITHNLISRASRLAGKKASDALQTLMVREALQNAQRAYVMLPEQTILGICAEAFEDVVIGRKTETRTTLAYDALKALPRMDLASCRALSLLLLFYYSRNEQNTSPHAFREYGERYVKPLISDLPGEYGGYQQLEYLHCISLENKDMPLGQVLRDFYPLVFSYRGCQSQEIKAIATDWPQDAFVPSVYTAYMKPAVIDDDMLPDFFSRCGITDERRQTLLSALFHSRPVTYDRKEMEHILGKIDPVWTELQEAWDESMLRRSSLTLMGMYIAQLYLRVEMNEDFDLSHWI